MKRGWQITSIALHKCLVVSSGLLVIHIILTIVLLRDIVWTKEYLLPQKLGDYLLVENPHLLLYFVLTGICIGLTTLGLLAIICIFPVFTQLKFRQDLSPQRTFTTKLHSNVFISFFFIATVLAITIYIHQACLGFGLAWSGCPLVETILPNIPLMGGQPN